MKAQHHNIGLLLNSAKGFLDVGHHIGYTSRNDDSKAAVERIPALAMNLSFSAELFLKAITLIQNKAPSKGHNLARLFANLKPETQDDIRQRFQKFIKSKLSFDTLPYYAIRIDKVDPRSKDSEPSQMESESQSLDEFLAQHANGFDNWRYLHEIPEHGYTYHFDSRRLHCFIASLVEHINNLERRPDFILEKAIK